MLKEATGGLAYALYGNTSTTRPAGFLNIASDLDVTGPAALALNAWSHLAMTFDGTTMRLYVNGTQVATRAASGSARSSTAPLRFGGNTVWAEWFTGRLDELRVYDRVLTAADVQADMSRPITG